MPSYKQYAVDLCPPFLQGTNGQKWLRGFNNHIDGMLDDTKAGVKARFPDEAAAQNDTLALGAIGSDSRLQRYAAETDDGYAARLKARFEYHRKSGTKQAVIDELEGLGYGAVTVMSYIDWPADGTVANLHHSPGSWYDSTGVTPWWSRSWVFIGEYDGDPIPSGGVLGTGVLGTMILGAELPEGGLDMAISAIRQRKPAHALLASITFLTDDTPIESVLGYGVLGSMVLGAAGTGSGAAVAVVNK